MNNKFRIWDDDNKNYEYLDFDNLNALVESLDSVRSYFSSTYLKDKNYLEFSTGLKDSKGREVYEGDIIEFDRKEWGGNDNIHFVSWNKEDAEFCFGGGAKQSDMEWRTVIGNINENPELLKS